MVSIKHSSNWIVPVTNSQFPHGMVYHRVAVILWRMWLVASCQVVTSWRSVLLRGQPFSGTLTSVSVVTDPTSVHPYSLGLFRSIRLRWIHIDFILLQTSTSVLERISLLLLLPWPWDSEWPSTGGPKYTLLSLPRSLGSISKSGFASEPSGVLVKSTHLTSYMTWLKSFQLQKVYWKNNQKLFTHLFNKCVFNGEAA